MLFRSTKSIYANRSTTKPIAVSLLHLLACQSWCAALATRRQQQQRWSPRTNRGRRRRRAARRKALANADPDASRASCSTRLEKWGGTEKIELRSRRAGGCFGWSSSTYEVRRFSIIFTAAPSCGRVRTAACVRRVSARRYAVAHITYIRSFYTVTFSFCS